jgi:hypothetical protein
MEEQKAATEDFSSALNELRELSIRNKENVKVYIENLSRLMLSLDRIRTIVDTNQNNSNILYGLVEKFVLVDMNERKEHPALPRGTA